jgi:hypothetical protein
LKYKIIMRLLIVLFLVAFAVSCKSTRTKNHSASHENDAEWSSVALVDGNNRVAQEMVRSALKRHNIECYMEGSLGYDVVVPSSRSKEAKEVLRNDPNLRHEWLRVSE